MPDVYAVSSAKGGVGKTTTAVNLAATLAAAGNEVVAVDGDIGTPNFGPALGVEPTGATIHDLLAGEATVADATYEGPHGLRVVPGRDDLAAFREADPGRLGPIIEEIDAEYVIVDTSAGLTHGSALPMSVADGTLLVTTPDRDALAATRKTAELTRELGGTVAGVALNRAAEGDEATGLDAPVLGRIPDSATIVDACAAAEPITVYAPASPEAAAYRRLASRLTVSRVSPPPGVDAADETGTAAGVGGATAGAGGGAASDAGSSTPSGADARSDTSARDDENAASVEPRDETPGDAESAVSEADGAFGLDPYGDRASADHETDAAAGSESATGGAYAAGDEVTTGERRSAADEPTSGEPAATDEPTSGEPAATDEPTSGEPATADEPTVVDTGGKDEDLIVAAGSEVEAAEEAKTVLGEPVPEEAIERTETARGDAVEYEIDRDAIPFADDERDDEDEEDDDRGFFSRLFGS